MRISSSGVAGRRLLAVAATLLLPLSVGVAGPATAATSATAPSRPLMGYLLASDSVVPVDLATRALGTPIAMPTGVRDMVVSPDGRTAYVLVGGAVRPLDLVTGTLYPGTYIGRYAAAMALTPDGSTAWVIDTGARDVTPVDLRSGRAGTPVEPGGGDPQVELSSIAITPDGRTAYVATGCGAAVYPIDLSTSRVGAAIVPPARGDYPYPCPGAVAVAPDGRSGYISDQFSTAGLSPFDVATGALRAPIRLGGADAPAASQVVIGPGSDRALVTTSKGLLSVDTVHGRVTGRYTPALYGQIAVHPSGRTLLVPLRKGGVWALSASTLEPGEPFASGLVVNGIIIAPDQPAAAGFTGTSGGTRTLHLDATSSVAVTSPIATYRWDFGDGTSRTTTGPVVDHTYPAAGRVQVRLTVTDTVGTSTQPLYDSVMLLRNGGPRATTTRSLTVR